MRWSKKQRYWYWSNCRHICIKWLLVFLSFLYLLLHRSRFIHLHNLYMYSYRKHKRQTTNDNDDWVVRCALCSFAFDRLEFVFSELNFPHQRACGYEYAQCCQGERKRKRVSSMLSLWKINHSSKILNEMKWHQYHWNGVIPSNCVTWFTCLLSLVHVFII